LSIQKVEDGVDFGVRLAMSVLLYPQQNPSLHLFPPATEHLQSGSSLLFFETLDAVDGVFVAAVLASLVTGSGDLKRAAEHIEAGRFGAAVIAKLEGERQSFRCA
jgi:hypothetical protein